MLTSAGYVAFAETRSDHQLLAPEIRDPLLANVKAAIDAIGGRFEWPYETHLYMARLRTGSPAG